MRRLRLGIGIVRSLTAPAPSAAAAWECAAACCAAAATTTNAAACASAAASSSTLSATHHSSSSSSSCSAARLDERATSSRWASTSAAAAAPTAAASGAHRCRRPYHTSSSIPAAAGSKPRGTPAAAAAAAAQSSFEAQEAACWACHQRHRRGSVTCASCERIQPLDPTVNHFDVLGIPSTFDVDLAELDRRYKQLLWALHPDRAAGLPAEERGYGAAGAARLNAAYGVLRRPLSRANYLLALAGAPAPGDAEAERSIQTDPALLMEVMEAREAVEAADSPEELRPLLAAARGAQAEVERELSAAFAARDLALAARLVARLTYHVRLEESIMERL